MGLAAYGDSPEERGDKVPTVKTAPQDSRTGTVLPHPSVLSPSLGPQMPSAGPAAPPSAPAPAKAPS